jgi:hypothetical protein
MFWNVSRTLFQKTGLFVATITDCEPEIRAKDMENGADASDSMRQALDAIDADHNFQVQDIVAIESAADIQIAAADEVFQLEARNADDLDMRARDLRNVAHFVLTNALRAREFAIQEHVEAATEVTETALREATEKVSAAREETHAQIDEADDLVREAATKRAAADERRTRESKLDECRGLLSRRPGEKAHGRIPRRVRRVWCVSRQ